MTGARVVTFLGGVQPMSDQDEVLAFATGRYFGELGYTLRHGGYNGLMEDAARGAAEVGANVVALTLAGKEDEWGAFNPYVKEVVHAPNMGARLMRLIDSADVIVGMGGGVGTLHELTAAIYYAGNVRSVPVILAGDAACRLHDFLVADRWLYRSPTRPLDFLHAVTDLPALASVVSGLPSAVAVSGEDGNIGGDAFTARMLAAGTVDGLYTLADGTVLGQYFDPFLVAANPVLSADLAEVVAQQLDEIPDVVAGLVLGGVPLATDLSRLLRRPLLQVRPAPKEYGTFRRVEGPAVAGDRALLVDDVVRSGRHLGSAVGQLRDAGLVVNAAACVIVRSPTGAGLLSELGVTLHSLIAADASQVA
ncbi:MAG TPA: LOG family protein [Streptosporangiaceae bacterium]